MVLLECGGGGGGGGDDIGCLTKVRLKSWLKSSSLFRSTTGVCMPLLFGLHFLSLAFLSRSDLSSLSSLSFLSCTISSSLALRTEKVSLVATRSSLRWVFGDGVVVFVSVVVVVVVSSIGLSSIGGIVTTCLMIKCGCDVIWICMVV